MERNNTTIWLAIFLLSLVDFSSPANSQSDSCSSQLSVSNLIPFDTASFHCFSAWNSEGFILRYAQSGQNLWNFVLSAPDAGSYISIGFSSDGRMDGSSAVAGWITSNGPGIVKRYYLGGKSSRQCPPDQGSLQLVANNSLIVSQSSRLYLAFQLSTSQPAPYLIYAVGPSNSIPSSDYYLSTHQNQASASINYATGVASDGGSRGFPARRWHGLLTMLGWGVLMPVGVIMARYFKHLDPLWFYSHISIQGIGFVLGLVGIIAGFNLDDNLPNADTHQAIGICILICGSLQVMAFLIRPDKSSKIRRYWNWYHHYVGRAAIALAVANIFLGLSVAHEDRSWTVGYVIFLVVWVIASLLLELKRRMKKDDLSCVIGICSAIWFYIQKKNIGYSNVGLSYETAIAGQYWRIITSAFSHISVVHLVFNMSALWSLGVVEQLGHLGLGIEFYLQYTLVLVVLSGVLVLLAYHILIQKFKLEYFRRVTAVGYSCVVFGWMTILAVKQPSSKLNLFGVLSLPISFAPFESLIFTSIIVPQASFIGHLSGIIVGYSIAWGLIHGMSNYWAISMLGWLILMFILSLKRTGAVDLPFIEIEPVTDPSLPAVGFIPSGNGRTLQMNILHGRGAELV
ncbi:unnamed protein product [Musa hybrid cultivar]